MKNKDKSFLIYSFYRFTEINNIREVKTNLDLFFLKKGIKGTILLAKEGINASLSGTTVDLEKSIKHIKRLLNIRKLEIKIHSNDFLPFKKLKIKLKREIVNLAKGEIDIKKFEGKRINPSEWNKIIKNKNIKVLDVRNNYEIEIGKFKYSQKPNTDNFRDFPSSIKKLKINKNTKIAMYCTGGIRCEKASAYLKSNGYRNVMQLDGGILKYLEHAKNNKVRSLWQGECFVFDERVTVNKNLDLGRYYQCYGCRMPITKDDLNSIYYQKGVSCHHCYHIRSKKQKIRSLTRQKQIDKAEENQKNHSFKKIYN